MSGSRRRSGAGPRRGFAAAVLALVVGPAALPAQPPPRPAIDALFPWQAPIVLERDGGATPGRIARLFLPAPVLSATRTDLSDLRLLDVAGREIPFAVDRDAGLRRRVDQLETAVATIRSASQSRSRVEETVTRWSETYELSPPPSAWSSATGRSGRERLFLHVLSSSPRFVKRLRAETLGRERPPPLADESLFRLPDPLRERVRFELPIGAAALRDETLRVELEGEDGGWLEPTFSWEREVELADQPEPRTVDLPLPSISSSREGGETVLILERPRGVAPLAIVFETTTPLLRRRVAVFDSGPGVARRRLLEGEIRRVGERDQADPPLVLSWPTATRAAGGQLEVRVLDRDSPPLADLEVALRLARPALLFAADSDPVRLVWGGARVRAPRYDVGALVPSLPATGEAAAVGRPLLDEAALLEATLGEPEANPRFDPVSPLEFAMAPGRELDPRTFSHARRLSAPPADLGLYRLALGADDQAVLRADLGDLRIVDPQNRQRPYLLVEDAGRERVPAALRATHPAGETLLRLDPATAPVLVTGIRLQIDDPFFERPYTVEAEVAGADRPEILARGVLRRESGAATPAIGSPPGASPLELALPARRIRSLAVRIVDGSDRPLSVRGAEVEIPTPEVLFPASSGEYLALLGEPDLEPPRYQLESVRGLVQAIDSSVVESGPLGPNERFSLGARLGRGSGLERTILGVALAVAVLALTVVTLRLAGPRPGAAGGVPNSAQDENADVADDGGAAASRDDEPGS